MDPQRCPVRLGLKHMTINDDSLGQSCSDEKSIASPANFNNTIDDDVDDDDLIEVAFLQLTCKNNGTDLTNQKDEEMVSEACSESDAAISSDPKELSVEVKQRYKFVDLDSILNERKLHQSKETTKENTIAEVAVEEANILEKNKLDWKKYEFQPENILQHNPGVEIFELNACSRFHHLPLISQFGIGKSDVFTDILLKIGDENLPERLPLIGLEQKVGLLVNRHWLLSYLYHILALHPDCLVVQGCYNILEAVQQHYTLEAKNNTNAKFWSPSLKDIVFTFMIYGAPLSTLIPEPFLFPHSKDELLNEFGNKFQQQDKESNQGFPEFNCRQNLLIISDYVKLLIYDDNELAALLIMFCGISLDKKALYLREVQLCIASVIALMSNDFWETQVNALARTCLKFTSHHHDFVFLSKMMPYTKRGLQLQKLICFAALHTLTKNEIDQKLTSVTLQNVHNFFKENLLTTFKDSYLFYSIIFLVDICVGNQLNSSNKKILPQLIQLMKMAAGKIRDRIHFPGTTEVKNFMVIIVSKWTFMAQDMPSTQRTLFSYPTTYYDMQVVNDGAISDTDDKGKY